MNASTIQGGTPSSGSGSGSQIRALEPRIPFLPQRRGGVEVVAGVMRLMRGPDDADAVRTPVVDIPQQVDGDEDQWLNAPNMGVVYGYFESKEGLFQACLHRAGEAIVAAVEAAQSGVTLTRAIDTLGAIFETLEPRPYDWSILWDATLPPGSAVYHTAAEYRSKLIVLGSTGTREVLHAAGDIDDLDASLLTAVWLSTVTTVVQWWLDHPGQDAAATTERCTRLLRILAGVRGRRSTREVRREV